MSEKEPVRTQTEWRFIDDGAHSGAENMARDEALAESVGEGAVPALRVYTFEPPAVSLGRFQEYPGSFDLERCRAAGVDFVRRPSGGLAILHYGDFTYSLSLPRSGGGPGVARDFFLKTASALVESLSDLGIRVRPVEHSASSRSGTWCFGACFGADIEWGNRKICGSAIRVYGASVLQHGSLFLSVDENLLRDLAFDGADRSYFVTLPEAGGRKYVLEEVSGAFRSGFSRALGVKFETAAFSGKELERADELLRERYGTEKWLLEVTGDRSRL